MDRLRRVSGAIGAILFLFLIIAVAYQVIARYLLKSPAGWTEEVALLLFIWVIFWNATFTVAIHEHISFDVVFETLTRRSKRIARAFTLVSMSVIFLFTLSANWEYFQFLDFQQTGTLQVSYRWVFLPYFLFAAIVPVIAIVSVLTASTDDNTGGH